MNRLDTLHSLLTEVDAFYKTRGIFQEKFGFGVCPALVVIDMAYGWTDPAYAGGSARLDSAIAAIQQLLPVARTKGIPMIYTTSPFPQTQIKSAADFSAQFRKWDQRACEIDERVKPWPGESIVYKEHASAFAGTALIGYLISKRVDTLLITGCSTSACVRATATDAKSNQLKPIVIREAVQDRSEILHEFTLLDLQARFADVVELNEAVRYLQELIVDQPAQKPSDAFRRR
jgi:nicotinamidase-related amidase